MKGVVFHLEPSVLQSSHLGNGGRQSMVAMLVLNRALKDQRP
jgi:hypothetical protein